MKRKVFIIVVLILSVFLLGACKKEEETINNVQETVEKYSEDGETHIDEEKSENIEMPEKEEQSTELDGPIVEEDLQKEFETSSQEYVEIKEETMDSKKDVLVSENISEVETSNTENVNNPVIDNGGSISDNSSTETDNSGGSGTSSGGIAFVHECTTWETVSQKISDAYTYQELVQKGYNCGVCNVVFDTYSDVCPGCGSACINNNYILEDRVAPAIYMEYEICTRCGNTANSRTVEK